MNPARNKIYFASDFHLGIPDYHSSLEREKAICRWLDIIKTDAAEIFLMGDLFDFWFEHNYTVPKGYVRLLGKIANLTDSGIPVHLFTGNHDMWMFDYLEKELNVRIHRTAIEREFGSKKFFLAHGDGLGPGDRVYKFYKWFFIGKFWQWCYARLHPNFSMWLGQSFSRGSRKNNKGKDKNYLGDDKEFLVLHCQELLKTKHFDYFIFGHRHLPITKNLSDKSKYINLGEWINYRSYAVFEDDQVSLKYFNS